MGVNYNYTRLSNTLRLYTWWNSCTETNDPRHCTLFLQAQGTSLSSIYAFNVYIQTTRNLVFNTLDVKQHMVALQHSIRSDSVTHSAKIFPETLCVRLSRATLLYTLWTTTAWQCGAFIALEALLKVSLGALAGVAPHFLPQLSILLHDRHFCYGARWFTTIGMFFPDLKRDSVSKVSSSNEKMLRWANSNLVICICYMDHYDFQLLPDTSWSVYLYQYICITTSWYLKY